MSLLLYMALHTGPIRGHLKRLSVTALPSCSFSRRNSPTAAFRAASIWIGIAPLHAASDTPSMATAITIRIITPSPQGIIGQPELEGNSKGANCENKRGHYFRGLWKRASTPRSIGTDRKTRTFPERGRRQRRPLSCGPNVRFGSFATEPFRASVERCPLRPESDLQGMSAN